MRIFNNIDWLLLIPILLISFLSILILLSIDISLAKNQFIYLLIGLFLYFLLANIDYKIFKNLSLSFYIISILLLLVTLVLGRVTRGSVRWIKVGFLNFQSSEFVKPLFILIFSFLASKFSFSKIKDIFLFFLYFLIPAFLIFKQPDLGNSLVLFAIWLGIILAAGIKKTYFIGSLAAFLILLPVFWHVLKPYQQQRIISFLNPQFDPLGSGYHLIQSMITVGSGEFFGRGLGRGNQSQLQFLPERHTDFIFASFAEEFGFLGSTILLFCYFVLLLKIILLAQRSQDLFGSLISIGIFSMIFFQLLVNIGMNLGLIPITGVTLPLFSSGGSSLVTTLISLGIIQNIAHYQQRKEVIEIG